MKACYLLELQATQREPRNWVTSTHGGSGTVILNVIFTEATREFLWVTAKNQYAGRWRREVGGRGTRSTSFFFLFYLRDHSLCLLMSSFLPLLSQKHTLLNISGLWHALAVERLSIFHLLLRCAWCKRQTKVLFFRYSNAQLLFFFSFFYSDI